MPTISATGSGFGAYVMDIDLCTPPTASTLWTLQHALDEYLVLILRPERAPSDAEVVAFCQAFGPLRPSLADKSRLPDHPAINLVANFEVGSVEGSGGSGALHFHSDLHHEPPLIEFIYLDAVAVPASGGATRWVDLCAAYEALDHQQQAQIDRLTIRYSLRKDLDFDVYFKASADGLAQRRQSTAVSLVQTNSRTGRKALWANTGPQSNHRAHVIGMNEDESDALLQELFEHCTQDRFLFSHTWHPGEACLWHNLQTLHGRTAFDPQDVRIMRHVNVLGITDPHQLTSAAD